MAEVRLVPSFIEGMLAAEVPTVTESFIALHLTNKQLTQLMHGDVIQKYENKPLSKCVERFRRLSWEKQQQTLIRNNVMVYGKPKDGLNPDDCMGPEEPLVEPGMNEPRRHLRSDLNAVMVHVVGESRLSRECDHAPIFCVQWNKVRPKVKELTVWAGQVGQVQSICPVKLQFLFGKACGKSYYSTLPFEASVSARFLLQSCATLGDMYARAPLLCTPSYTLELPDSVQCSFLVPYCRIICSIE